MDERKGNQLGRVEETAGLKTRRVNRLRRRRFFIGIVSSILLGVFFGYALEAVVIPNGLLDGGITGISIILYKLTGISMSIYLVVLNIPFIYMLYKLVGKTSAILTTIGIASVSVSSTLMHHIEPIVTKEDMTIVIVLGGIMMGSAVGLILKGGAMLDGMDVLADILSEKLPFSTAEIILGINVIIFVIAGFLFGLESAMYSIITYLVVKLTIDVIEKGLSTQKEIEIIASSDEQLKEISKMIQFRLGRGVTYFKAEGGFSGKEYKSINCTFSRMEETKMENIISEIDEEAYYVIRSIDKVHGGSFKKRSIH